MEGRDHSDHSCINLCVFVLTLSKVSILLKKKSSGGRESYQLLIFFDEFLEVELY